MPKNNSSSRMKLQDRTDVEFCGFARGLIDDLRQRLVGIREREGKESRLENEIKKLIKIIVKSIKEHGGIKS